MTYPPQQGPGPYGQPYQEGQQPPQQHPQGYPPQQGYGYPQQPYPPQQQWNAPPAPTPPSRGGGMGVKKIFQIVAGVIVAIMCVVGYFASQNDADHAEAGDCLKNNGTTLSPDLQVVECGGADATYKVVEVIPDTLETSKCEGKSDIGYEERQTGRRSSGKQFVLCIDEIKK
ncbi:LppU/SCO3897 family protein [Streptomyces flavidovirens]